MKTIAVIGGGGISLPFLTDKKNQVVTTPYGDPSGELEIGYAHGVRVVFLSRHGGDYRILAHRVNYRANLYALSRFSVEAVIGIGTVGGITAPAGTIMVPDQLIDYTSQRENSFFGDGDNPKHIDFTEPFDYRLREQLLFAAHSCDRTVMTHGVYAVTNGPRLETAAEIRRLKQDGADIVGMTAMPEAILARELSLPYALICPVVNSAAGIEESRHQVDLQAVHQRMSLMATQVAEIMEAFIQQ